MDINPSVSGICIKTTGRRQIIIFCSLYITRSQGNSDSPVSIRNMSASRIDTQLINDGNHRMLEATAKFLVSANIN
jgi:hypothetical protein